MSRLCTVVFLFAITPVLRAQWTVTVLDPPTSTISECWCSNQGQQVGNADLGNGREAVLWTGSAGSLVSLHPPGATQSFAQAVENGRQVGFVYPVNVSHAGYWTGTAASFVDLNPAGASESAAYGIAGGLVVGRAKVGTQTHACTWNTGSNLWTDVHPLGSTYSVIAGTDGLQHVGQQVLGQPHATLWNATTVGAVDLHPAGATQSFASGVDHGQQVGTSGYGLYGTPLHPALWSGTPGSFVDLLPAGANNGQAYGVHQGVQCGYATFGFTLKAGLWFGSAASYVDLHAYLPVGFTGSQAFHVVRSPNGVITVVGAAYMSGHNRAVIWTSGPSAWSDLGQALPGSYGAPALAGFGTLQTGSGNLLALANAGPGSPAVLALSFASNPVPLLGGTLVPYPTIASVFMPASIAGTVHWQFPTWPAGYSGLHMFAQFAIVDGGAVQGVAFSNAVRGDVP